MGRPKTVDQCKKLCVGCRQDRYNHKGVCERPGIDAPVTSDHCWSLEPLEAIYCRAKKMWVMPCHSDPFHQWIAEWGIKGKKPAWNYY
jgi:hypothetical protein